MENKFFLKSKTILFNLILVVLLVITENSELIKPLLSNEGYSWLMLIVAFINMYLRTATNSPIRFK